MTDDPMHAVRWFHAVSSLSWAGPPRAPAPNKPGTSRFPCPESIRQPSTRRFRAPAPGLGQVADLIRAAYGEPPAGSRAVPSAGAIYGLSFYLMLLGDETVWQLDPRGQPSPVTGCRWSAAGAEILDQIAGSAVVLFMCGASRAYVERYGPRGYRYLYLEAGHCAQEIIRGAQGAGLRSCPLGAFDDQGVLAATGTSLTDLLPLYALAIGTAEEKA